MAKALLTLPNGTVVDIEGSTEEVKDLLQFYGGGNRGKPSVPKQPSAGRTGAKKAVARPEQEKGSDVVDLTEVVNLVKSCDEAEEIETRILDKTSQVDRTLLPLYVVHEHFENRYALSSGDVTKVTTELSVPVSISNASRTLAGTASRYVVGNKVRKQGAAVRYKLNRRGVKYMKSVISGSGDD